MCRACSEELAKELTSQNLKKMMLIYHLDLKHLFAKPSHEIEENNSSYGH